MKTTIEIADPLLKQAKKVAARRGVTLRVVVEEALRSALEAEAGREGAFRLRDASVDGQGLQAGVDVGNWDALRDLAYEGRGA